MAFGCTMLLTSHFVPGICYSRSILSSCGTRSSAFSMSLIAITLAVASRSWEYLSTVDCAFVNAC